MALHIPSKFTEKFLEKFEKFNFSSDYESADSMSIPSTPSTPCSPIADLFDIQIIEKSDRDDVLHFLRTFFYKDEPLNAYLNLINEKNPRCLDLEKYSLKELDNGLNLKAVGNDGKLMGICLNGIIEKDAPECEEDIKDKKFSKIVELLEHVARESNVFQHFPDCNKAMTVKIISVDGTYRGKGIAKDLMARSRDLARENNCGFMTVDCTSHFTAMALKKLGFKLSYSLNYSDYKKDGKPVFTPAEPHRAVTVYTQRVY